MSFIQREIERVGNALTSAQPDNRYAELYAVQQALVWALEPAVFKSPYDMIAASDIPGGSGDCPARSDPFLSLDSPGLHGS
jgi:hypothetical protein